MRLLKEAHEILLSGVRGAHKQPGQIRTSQNWIGGSSIKTASFIPPHPDELPAAIKDFEYFLHNRSLVLPQLIQIAIAHYQFETIHPFLDGNGRIGRLLITLHLVDLGVLKKPTLYLSDYLEKNKCQYYDGLTFVRTQNNMDQWLIYFLSAIIDASKNGKELFEKIINLRSRYEQNIMGVGRRAKLARRLLLNLFSNPAITNSKAAKMLTISINSANRLIAELVQIEILKEITGFSRNRVFVLTEYLELFRK